MGYLLLAARLILAGVLAVAALGKLADRPGSRQALVEFGVPIPLTAPLATLLPLAELAVAVALLPVASAWFGALGALGLLLAFVVGIAYNLARGRTPDCHCFGRLHSAPAGWSQLVRNAVLAALAGLVIVQGPDQVGPSALAWLLELSIAQRLGLGLGLVVLALLTVEAWLLVGMLRQNGRLLLRIEALEQRISNNGALPAPDQIVAASADDDTRPRTLHGAAHAFILPDLAGTAVSLDDFRGDATLMLFWNPRCGFCRQMLPDLHTWEAQSRPGAPKLLLISTGAVEENRALGLRSRIVLDEGFTVGRAFGATGTPSAVLVDRNGNVASKLAVGRTAILELIGAEQDAMLVQDVVRP